MRYLVTGGAGFIGSHLVDRLIDKGDVRVYDNLSNGKLEFLSAHQKKPNFEFVEADLLDKRKVLKAMKGVDFVYHLAANPDIRFGTANTDVDLTQGTIVTHNVLEAMRLTGVKGIAFSSSQTVCGDPSVQRVPEEYGPMIPISLYGASKLAAEALITAYSHTFEIQGWVFRFANVIGERSNHGVIYDFINKLKKNPKTLEILGDGAQSKSYLMAQDVVDAIMFGVENAREGFNLFNIGTDDWISVTRIAEIIVEECGLKGVEFQFTGGKRGWKGDVPRIMLETAKMKRLGWKPKWSSEQAVRTATKILVKELW